MAIKQERYSKEALEEVFGTPNPSQSTIVRWKNHWKSNRGRVKVTNYYSSIKILQEADIDPLFYQLDANVDTETQGGPVEQYYIVFYKKEHEVFFKLHAGID